MFSKIAEFFIKNSKLTLVLVLVSLIAWVWSYLVIPKQYNPTIKAPAFQIIIKTPWFDTHQNQILILNEMENKIWEIPWIDKVFWVIWENYVWVMAQFLQWEDKEISKVKISEKFDENMDLIPIWTQKPSITSINPDDLSQITYAISYTWNDLKNQKEIQIYLRQIANIIKNNLKNIENTTTLEIVWWLKKDIFISLDLSKIEALNLDIWYIYNKLKENDLKTPLWDITLNNGAKVALWLDAKLENIDDLKNFVIYNNLWKIITLWDIANFEIWQKKVNMSVKFWDKENISNEAILIWVWKKVWVNSIFLTQNVKKEIKNLENTLPKDIKITLIQDEWHEAQEATNSLIEDLISSIIIVILLLIYFLWWRNALNTATSIPIILSLVFLLSYIVWFDINRISLFALILVIWMLVDDSIVVVENIQRHLEEDKNWLIPLKTKILIAVKEVWSGVLLSTITKILAFSWMFAVSWMMWEYMWPIPLFAIIALSFSLIVAFSINPWISNIVESRFPSKKEIKKTKKFDIRDIYVKFLKKFLTKTQSWRKNRKIFKITFWISLFLVILIPIQLWVFKARMLPKSNKDQVYLWIDNSRWTSISKQEEIEKDIETFFLKNESLPKELQITKDISSSIWTPFMWDFANLFRWWLERSFEHQISSRINLISKDENKNRISSEEFTIKIRPLLRDYLLKKYPDLTLRLLEDPPGPPVKASFNILVKWWNDKKDLDLFTLKVQKEIFDISKKQDLVDIWNNFSTTYRKINLKIDQNQLALSNLDLSQIIWWLHTALNWSAINVIYDKNSLETTNIILWIGEDETSSLDFLDKIYFINKKWEKIPLLSVVWVQYTFVEDDINTDKKQITNSIYSEIGNNSVVYPVLDLRSRLLSKDFLKNDYKVIKKCLYGVKLESLKDGAIYEILFDWEWKITLDTFKDMWVAMAIAILAIYFIMVAEFSSFVVWWIIMLPFLLWFFWIFPWFSILYLISWEYFSATWMIWIISLAWIVVWNSILLLDYVNLMKNNWESLENSLLKAWYIRFMPIMITSIAAIFWAIKIAWDPVWSGLAWSIVFWLWASAILTLIVIPIFYFDSQEKVWEEK